MKTYRDYGITEGTMKAMWEFFMKTSIPRNAKKRLEGKGNPCHTNGTSTQQSSF